MLVKFCMLRASVITFIIIFFFDGNLLKLNTFQCFVWILNSNEKPGDSYTPAKFLSSGATLFLPITLSYVIDEYGACRSESTGAEYMCLI